MNSIKAKFLLRPDITFLNNGSFGACPKEVFADYQKWQLELEQEPVQFITINSYTYLAESRKALSAYIHCDAEDIVFVTNPSYAVNIIAKSFVLQEGDEILTTNLEYGACEKTWNYYCKKSKATFVKAEIQLPIVSTESFIEQFFSGLTSRTKMVFISQITSTTGLVLPVAEICAKAKQLGLITFVDGAHTPGQLPLNLTELQADIFTGACHKWLMAPKGCSFLYIKKELQQLFDPLVVSWGYDSAKPSSSLFLDYHQLQGTRDISAFLTIPKALAFMEENNWDEITKGSKKLVLDNASRFCALLGTQPLCPINETYLAQLFSIPIITNEPEKLQALLFQKYKIEIPVMVHFGKVYMRFSVQGFNTQEDLDILYAALQDILATTDLIGLPN